MATTQTKTQFVSALTTREKAATEKDSIHISLSTAEIPSKGVTAHNIHRTSERTASNPKGVNGSRTAQNNVHIISLAQEITASVTEATTGNEAARLKVATAALELAAAVRPPSDTIMFLFTNMSVVSAIRVFQHWGVFDLIPSDPTQDITCSEIARKIRAEEGIVSRISAMLMSSHILALTSTGGLAHTPTSLLLRSTEPMAAMFDLMYTNIVLVSNILPDYFDTYGRKEPIGPNHVPATVLTGEPELEFFESVSRNEERMRNFIKAMKVTSGRVPVTGLYPLDQVLHDVQDGRVTWVDVGGGAGHVLRRFREGHAALRRSKCVVVDLKCVVDEGRDAATNDEVMKGVEWVEGDFMKEIPVKGARFYYLRHILRDYSDPMATLILRTVAEVMSCDSRVLISEQINPDGDSKPGRPMPLYAAFKDYSMLAIGGKERSLNQFRKVAEQAGLKVETMYRDEKGTGHGVVELVMNF